MPDQCVVERRLIEIGQHRDEAGQAAREQRRFREELLAFLDSRSLRLSEDDVRKAARALAGGGAAVSRYVLVSARRPVEPPEVSP